MINVGIVGGAGYTAGELIRLLVNHPDVEIKFVNSNSNAGNPLYQVHSGLFGETDMLFTDKLELDSIDLLFFCTAHGDTKKFMQEHALPEDLKIIDLSMDYRLADTSHDFVYGLPEVNRKYIIRAKHIANPGCFATAIQLALLPMAKNLMLNNPVHITAITGSTGAGQKPSSTSHFSWRDNNISIYKPFKHQHIAEIKETLKSLQTTVTDQIDFIPVRGCFARGIFAMLYTETNISLDEIQNIYDEYYSDHSFTHVTPFDIDLKQVVNTNKCLIHLQKEGDKLLITSAIDNLLKGASGTAVHNMNLLFGLKEDIGLKLKATAF